MEHRIAGQPLLSSGVNKGFIFAFILVVGIGVINFGFSIGVFNSMHPTLMGVLGITNKEERTNWEKYL